MKLGGGKYIKELVDILIEQGVAYDDRFKLVQSLLDVLKIEDKEVRKELLNVPYNREEEDTEEEISWGAMFKGIGKEYSNWLLNFEFFRRGKGTIGDLIEYENDQGERAYSQEEKQDQQEQQTTLSVYGKMMLTSIMWMCYTAGKVYLREQEKLKPRLFPADILSFTSSLSLILVGIGSNEYQYEAQIRLNRLDTEIKYYREKIEQKVCAEKDKKEYEELLLEYKSLQEKIEKVRMVLVSLIASLGVGFVLYNHQGCLEYIIKTIGIIISQHVVGNGLSWVARRLASWLPKDMVMRLGLVAKGGVCDDIVYVLGSIVGIEVTQGLLHDINSHIVRIIKRMQEIPLTMLMLPSIVIGPRNSLVSVLAIWPFILPKQVYGIGNITLPERFWFPVEECAMEVQHMEVQDGSLFLADSSNVKLCGENAIACECTVLQDATLDTMTSITDMCIAGNGRVYTVGISGGNSVLYGQDLFGKFWTITIETYLTEMSIIMMPDGRRILVSADGSHDTLKLIKVRNEKLSRMDNLALILNNTFKIPVCVYNDNSVLIAEQGGLSLIEIEDLQFVNDPMPIVIPIPGRIIDIKPFNSTTYLVLTDQGLHKVDVDTRVSMQYIDISGGTDVEVILELLVDGKLHMQ